MLCVTIRPARNIDASFSQTDKKNKQKKPNK